MSELQYYHNFYYKTQHSIGPKLVQIYTLMAAVGIQIPDKPGFQVVKILILVLKGIQKPDSCSQ